MIDDHRYGVNINFQTVALITLVREKWGKAQEVHRHVFGLKEGSDGGRVRRQSNELLKIKCIEQIVAICAQISKRGHSKGVRSDRNRRNRDGRVCRTRREGGRQLCDQSIRKIMTWGSRGRGNRNRRGKGGRHAMKQKGSKIWKVIFIFVI